MAENSSIQWTHHTFNPWEGCTKVSPGCANCYAEARAKRYGTVKWGPDGTRRIASETYWRQPIAWNKKAVLAGERHRVFCASLADVFENRPELVAPRRRLFRLIAQTPHLDWLLLTKRPENIQRFVWQALDDVTFGEDPAASLHPLTKQSFAELFPNVWLGASVENDFWSRRIYDLVQVPARVHFLSVEPLLGPISFTDGPLDPDESTMGEWSLLTDIEWVIVGGESGPNARDLHITWISDIVRRCREENVPVFVKQLGKHPYEEVCLHDEPLFEGASISNYKRALTLIDPKGGNPEEWPQHLRVRQFPEVLAS